MGDLPPLAELGGEYVKFSSNHGRHSVAKKGPTMESGTTLGSKFDHETQAIHVLGGV